MSEIFKSLDSLQSGLSASWKRNAAILNNVANVDTPGYKAERVEFESLYKEAVERESGIALKKTRDTHMDIGVSLDSISPKTVKDTGLSQRMDGNNVDIEREMSDFVKNVIYYNALSTKVTGQLAQLRMAIREGR